MRRIGFTAWLVLAVFRGVAWSAPLSLSLAQVKAEGPKALGATVEWRGMVEAAGSEQFVLRIGPDKAIIGIGPEESPPLREGKSIQYVGQSVHIKGRVVEVDTDPPTILLLSLDTSPPPLPAVADIPRTLPPGLANDSWYLWIMSFNPGLSAVTARLYARAIDQVSREHGADPRLVLSIVAAESAFRADAVSPVGAIGLGQLMPDTASRLGVKNPRDPMQNLGGCALLLSEDGARYRDVSLVVAAYNAGEGAVDKYGGIPPYAETQAYVRYVLALYAELKGLASKGPNVKG